MKPTNRARRAHLLLAFTEASRSGAVRGREADVLAHNGAIVAEFQRSVWRRGLRGRQTGVAVDVAPTKRPVP